jgi:putative endonuclease
MTRERIELARQGEDLAARHFQQLGYQIVARNYRCRIGEIDLVCGKGRKLVFVEVKTRQSLRYGQPEEAVSEGKRQKLFRLAEYYLAQKRVINTVIQFDVVAVLLEEGGVPRLSHFQRAIER